MKHDATYSKETAKAQPKIKKISLITAVDTAGISEKKLASKTKKAAAVFIAGDEEPKTKRNKSNSVPAEIKPTLKSVKVEASGKATELKTFDAKKVKPQTLKTVSLVGKLKSAKDEIKLSKAAQSAKSKIKVESIVEKIKPVTRKSNSIALTKEIKLAASKKVSPVSAKEAKQSGSTKIKSNVSAMPVKSKTVKPKASVLIEKIKTVKKQAVQDSVISKTKSQAKNNKAAKIGEVAKRNLPKIGKVVSAEKIENKKTKIKSAKSVEIISDKNIKAEITPVKSQALPKPIKLERNKLIKAKVEKIEPVVPVQTEKEVVSEIKTINQPHEEKPKRKRNKPIGSAIFRGQKDRYDFKVFTLDSDFENVPAIYIISRRIIDQRKKGHHALVCIGQTDSVLGEIKKHKNKCIKKHNANVISILPETDEKRRLKIEEDLRSAHTVVCHIG